MPLQLIMGKTRHKNPRTATPTSNPALKPLPLSPSISLRPDADTDQSCLNAIAAFVGR